MRDDRIVLKTNRAWLFGILNRHYRYTISADGSGEINQELPPGLGDEPGWSPDGQWVVFSTIYTSDLPVDQRGLYLMRADGTRRVHITKHPDNGSQPAWSADGTRIAYVAGGIRVLNVECLLRGEECQPDPVVVTTRHSHLDPAWSPDGKQIYYVDVESRESYIFAISADGTAKPTNITPNLKGCYSPRRSPDGTRFALSCDSGIYLMNADGLQLRRILEYGSNVWWSPDGSKIAFVSARDGLGKCVGGLCGSGGIYSDALFLMNADGSNVIRLSKRNDEEVLWYSWLPSIAKARKP